MAFLAQVSPPHKVILGILRPPHTFLYVYWSWQYNQDQRNASSTRHSKSRRTSWSCTLVQKTLAGFLIGVLQRVSSRADKVIKARHWNEGQRGNAERVRRNLEKGNEPRASSHLVKKVPLNECDVSTWNKMLDIVYRRIAIEPNLFHGVERKIARLKALLNGGDQPDRLCAFFRGNDDASRITRPAHDVLRKLY